jgi:hypothetical protein
MNNVKGLTPKEIDIIVMFDELVQQGYITKERAQELINERLDDISNDIEYNDECLEAAYKELEELTIREKRDALLDKVESDGHWFNHRLPDIEAFKKELVEANMSEAQRSEQVEPELLYSEWNSKEAKYTFSDGSVYHENFLTGEVTQLNMIEDSLDYLSDSMKEQINNKKPYNDGHKIEDLVDGINKTIDDIKDKAVKDDNNDVVEAQRSEQVEQQFNFDLDEMKESMNSVKHVVPDLNSFKEFDNFIKVGTDDICNDNLNEFMKENNILHYTWNSEGATYVMNDGSINYEDFRTGIVTVKQEATIVEAQRSEQVEHKEVLSRYWCPIDLCFKVGMLNEINEVSNEKQESCGSEAERSEQDSLDDALDDINNTPIW